MTANNRAVAKRGGAVKAGAVLRLFALGDLMKSACLESRIGVLVLALAFFAAANKSAHAAGDVKSGREKAHMCEVCHGLDGQGKVVEAPNLAGQNEQYMVKQLTAFKSGERQNEMMSVVAATLSQKNIEDLAAYYAAIPVTIGKLPGD
jgi:cytochrome c553